MTFSTKRVSKPFSNFAFSGLRVCLQFCLSNKRRVTNWNLPILFPRYLGGWIWMDLPTTAATDAAKASQYVYFLPRHYFMAIILNFNFSALNLSKHAIGFFFRSKCMELGARLFLARLLKLLIHFFPLAALDNGGIDLSYSLRRRNITVMISSNSKWFILSSTLLSQLIPALCYLESFLFKVGISIRLNLERGGATCDMIFYHIQPRMLPKDR